MRRHLLLALLLLNVPPIFAIEYGSTILQNTTTPYASLQSYSKRLCARTTARQTPNQQLAVGKTHFHIICEADGKQIGDVFAIYADGQLKINYRVASSEPTNPQ